LPVEPSFILLLNPLCLFVVSDPPPPPPPVPDVPVNFDLFCSTSPPDSGVLPLSTSVFLLTSDKLVTLEVLVLSVAFSEETLVLSVASSEEASFLLILL
jgi:hypothetical protein